MNYHVMTLFPEMIDDAMNVSILGRAIENQLINLETVNIRDYTLDKHKKVDDYTYGGGAGMLMSAQPVYDCHKDIMSKIESLQQKRVRTVYLTPQGRVFDQKLAKELSEADDIIFLCGHYEGIDERALTRIVTDYISVGDYVLTGGELPALVMMDCISRLVKGVLSNEESAMTESFDDGLLEYPQYTRPEIWDGESVPEVLLSGHHANISKWRHEQSLLRTKQRRPDLYDKYVKEHLDVLIRRSE